MSESTPETVSVPFTKEELEYINKFLSPEDYELDVEPEIEERLRTKIFNALEYFSH